MTHILSSFVYLLRTSRLWLSSMGVWMLLSWHEYSPSSLGCTSRSVISLPLYLKWITCKYHWSQPLRSWPVDEPVLVVHLDGPSRQKPHSILPGNDVRASVTKILLIYIYLIERKMLTITCYCYTLTEKLHIIWILLSPVIHIAGKSNILSNL